MHISNISSQITAKGAKDIASQALTSKFPNASVEEVAAASTVVTVRFGLGVSADIDEVEKSLKTVILFPICSVNFTFYPDSFWKSRSKCSSCH